MTALLDAGEKFGALEVVSLVSAPNDPEERYRLKCRRCRNDGVTASADALLKGRARLCYDCNALATLTPHQRVVVAFKRKLGSSTHPERRSTVWTRFLLRRHRLRLAKLSRPTAGH